MNLLDWELPLERAILYEQTWKTGNTGIGVHWLRQSVTEIAMSASKGVEPKQSRGKEPASGSAAEDEAHNIDKLNIETIQIVLNVDPVKQTCAIL